MSFEVELKFSVPDLAAFSRMLAERGSAVLPAQYEQDLYFAHPARDFARTDEALRLRQNGDANFITYKGPKIDATTKTRREIELPLGPGQESLRSWKALLEAVGFRAVAEVRKSRRKAVIPWQGRGVEMSLDEVQEVGSYVEFELIADEPDVEAAKACIVSLAASLGLAQGERRSYLELLLEHHARGRK